MIPMECMRSWSLGYIICALLTECISSRCYLYMFVALKDGNRFLGLIRYRMVKGLILLLYSKTVFCLTD